MSVDTDGVNSSLSPMRWARLRTHRGREAMWAGAVAVTCLLAYSLITWPWILDLWTRAKSGGDGGMFLWGFWWMRRAVETLTFPYFTDHALAPIGGNLLLNGLQLPALVSVPIQWIVGAALAYNLTTVASMVLAGLAMYALARNCGLRAWASLIAGLMFAAGPHLAFRYGGEHLNLAMAFWIPLLLLLVRRWLQRPTTRRATVCALALAGALYTDFTIAIFSAMLSGAYLVCLALIRPRRVGSALVLAPIATAIALLAVALLPLAVAVADAVRSGAFGIGGLGGSPYFSNDLLGLIVPNLRIEGPGHFGLAATGLALVAVVADRLRTPLVAWLALVTLACAWLSLGPHLVIGGVHHAPFPIQVDDSGERVSAVMPFTWVQAVLHDLRVPQRFLLLGSVPLALLAGMGGQALQGRFPRFAIAVCVAAVCLLLVEARTPPGDSVAVEPPPVYDHVVTNGEPATVVVDVPMGLRTGFVQIGMQLGAPLIYATEHEHPVSNGFFSRLPAAAQEEWASIPLYRDLLVLQQTGPDDPDPAVNPGEGHASAVLHHLEFVILHGAAGESDRIREYLTAACFTPMTGVESPGYQLDACPGAGWHD